MSPAEGEGEGDVEWDGLTDALGDKLAEGERDALGEREALLDPADGEADEEGEIDNEIERLVEALGELEAEGEREAEVTKSPISIKACPADIESTALRISRFLPILNEPFTPFSSFEDIPARKDEISKTFCLVAIG